MWLYDEIAPTLVDIVALDYDFWFNLAQADDTLDPDEEPTPLGSQGFLYYARFKHAGDIEEPTWVESPGRATVQEAMRDAEAKTAGPIKWQ